MVKIRPQTSAGEPLDGLIEDPWRTFECDPGPEGCVATFSDPDYAGEGRDAVYYARAIEESQPAINGGGVRCTEDAEGKCAAVDLCGAPGSHDKECLSPVEPRAWSSPIFLDFKPPRAIVSAP